MAKKILDANLSEFNSHSVEIKTGCGSMFLHILKTKDGTFHSVRANLGKSGVCATAQLNSYCELLSFIIQNAPLADVLLAVTNASGHRCQNNNLTCIDLLNRHVQNYVMDLMEAKNG